MSEILTIGEPLVVFNSTQTDVPLENSNQFNKQIGGAELNVAIGATRLGHSVNYISQVGTDSLGKFIINEINSAGINTRNIFSSTEYSTGHQFKSKVSSGDPYVENYRRNSACSHLTPDVINRVNLDGTKIAHFTGIFPAISPLAINTMQLLFNKLIAKRIPIVFDTNLRPSLWKSQNNMVKTINHFASQATIVLPGLKEGQLLTGLESDNEIADYYLNNEKTKAVIVKDGPDGALVKTCNGIKEFVPGFKVNHVIDTVGAGDGFALGTITALLENKSIVDAALRGNAIGSLQVQTPGDNDGYPTKQQLKKYYEKTQKNASGVKEHA
ncbi:2-dehydro-3-deoxygluconokinase [Lentilactobacillus curieae]|uniref:2-dehydro-3-deoxygluconokinase n=1 Tax=Lentilactobacillus curieae TaxID=1138822 RepID=A0A1S6QH40_9LACO|nr:sugar kinase [Lentilactobacillus curieae]AQW20936.1 2-dehydro-3-deoxygluconokinase [Lentilactobacillus curieae]